MPGGAASVAVPGSEFPVGIPFTISGPAHLQETISAGGGGRRAGHHGHPGAGAGPNNLVAALPVGVLHAAAENGQSGQNWSTEK